MACQLLYGIQYSGNGRSMPVEILVVENDQRVAAPVTEAIERWGHQVETAGTGHDALKRVSQKRFDLVLLDLHLPDCRGHQLIPRFKELWPDTGWSP